MSDDLRRHLGTLAACTVCGCRDLIPLSEKKLPDGRRKWRAWCRNCGKVATISEEKKQP